MATRSTAATSTLAEYWIKRYEELRKDRAPLQARWEKSYKNMIGMFDKADVWKEEEGEDWRSRTHLHLTRQKVMYAYAIIIDMMLQGGKMPYSISPAPWSQLNMQELPTEQAANIKDNISDWHKLLDQQMLEAQADREFMRCLLSDAEYGMTYMKLVRIPVERSGYRAQPLPGTEGMDMSAVENPEQYMQYVPYTESRMSVGVVMRPVWNIFRDLEKSNRDEWTEVIDRDYVSPWDLRQLKGPQWLKDQIKDVIDEQESESTSHIKDSKEKASMEPGLRDLEHRKRTIRILECWGRAPEERTKEFEKEFLKKKNGKLEQPMLSPIEEDNRGNEVEQLCVIANSRVIGFIRTSPEDRPIHESVWDEDLDRPGGVGVADNVKDMQKVINGAMRAFEDNKKLVCNTILAVKERYIKKMGKRITPGMKVVLQEQCQRASDAIQQITFQDVGAGLMELIGMGMNRGDEDSMVPKISQGMQEQQDQTAYEASQRLQQAGKYIGQVIRNQDERLVEPIVTAFYQYNMDDPDCPLPKGSYIVKATGYTSFQDRILTVSKLRDFLALLMLDPSFSAKWDLDKIIEKIAQGQDLDVDEFKKAFDEEAEQRQREAQAAEEERQMVLAERQAGIAKLNAEAEAARANAEKAQGQGQMERAKTVADIEAKRREDVLSQQKLGLEEKKIAVQEKIAKQRKEPKAKAKPKKAKK